MSLSWHIITGEYPPQPGGVSDYTRLIARGLADAGDRVDVWAPPAGQAETGDLGVTVHRLPDCFGFRSRRILSAHLDRLGSPQRILVQYVPHAFGWRGGNLPFCLWLRSRRRDSIWIMFHEVAFPFESGARFTHWGLAVVNRLMASIACRAAERAFVSIPAWLPVVEAMTRPGTSVTWLPVPSGIPFLPANGGMAAIRARYGGGRQVVGHFGTYGRLIKPLLEGSVAAVVEGSDCSVLLMGRHSELASRDLIRAYPALAGRVHASGPLAADDLSQHVSACDVMLQPYPDGISSRRTSAMVALSHGRPVVTTTGPLTEPLWQESGAVILVPAGDLDTLAAATRELLLNPGLRAELSARGKSIYERRFDLRHTIAALRASE